MGFWDGGPRGAPAIDLASGAGVASEVWRSGEPAAAPESGTGEDDENALWVAVPIQVAGWPWGCLAVRAPSGDPPEERQRRMIRFADLAGLAIEVVSERDRLHVQADTDPLTGLANRRAFAAQLAVAIEESRREGQPLCVVTIDLDHFKAVNDLHGHGTGDLALQHVAERIRLMARGNDTIARLGGDEFAWILPETPLATAAERAGFLRERIGGAPIANTDLAITASLGVTHLAPGDDSGALLARSDAALYEAKRLGGNRIQVSG